METTIIRYLCILGIAGVLCAEVPSAVDSGNNKDIVALSADTFTNVSAIIHNAEKVKPPVTMDGLKWFVGNWECVARLLTKKASFQTTYVYIDKIMFSYDLFKPMDKESGYIINAECTYVPPFRKKDTRLVEIEFNNKGFYYEMPYADHFILKKEPIKHPNWFILVHQVSGDILMFERMTDDDNKRKQ